MPRTKQKSRSSAVPEIASPFLTAAEVRIILRCSQRTIMRMAHGYTRPDGGFTRSSLPVTRRGRSILFRKSDIENYVAARTTVAGRAA